MKNWTGTNLCFTCAQTLGASINIGRQFRGRCPRCHSEQTLFPALNASTSPPASEDVCPECAHPAGTHAAACRKSELERLRRERHDVVRLLEEHGGYDPEQPLAEQLERLLRGD